MRNVVDPLDLVDPDRYRRGHPHRAWSELRAELPLARIRAGGYEPFVAVTRHADIKEIGSDPARFTSTDGMILSVGKFQGDQYQTVLNTDPPVHRDYRGVLSGYFKPHVMSNLEDRIRFITSNLLDELSRHSEVDLVPELATKLPLYMLAELMGIEESAQEEVMTLTQAFTENKVGTPGYDRARADFISYCMRELLKRKDDPQDDMTTVLAQASIGGDPLSIGDACAYLMIMSVAGHDTTKHAISSGLRELFMNDDQLAMLKADRTCAESAANEFVRWSSPTIHFMRTATADTEVGGQEILKGERLALFYPSGNRDETVFEDPFDFRIDRNPNPHLGWGHGEHYCLGAQLAKIEIGVLLSELSERLVSAQVIGDTEYTPSNFVCGPTSLPVRWRIR